MLYLARV